MTTGCVNADESGSVYEEMVRSHPGPTGFVACDDQYACTLCGPRIRRLDALASDCFTRGCTLDDVRVTCVYDPHS